MDKQKQKQIEEIEKFLMDRIINKTWRAKKLAKEIYEMIIPESAVVLTKKEQMARDYECYNLGYETHRQESQKREDYIKTLEYYINVLERALIIARKETAEKFAEKLKEKLNEWLEDNEDLDGKIDFGIAQIELIGVKSLDGEIIAESLIEEICKEITEGKNAKNE